MHGSCLAQILLNKLYCRPQWSWSVSMFERDLRHM